MKKLFLKIQKKWDVFVYARAYSSLDRLMRNNPVYAYVMEMQLHKWNKNHDYLTKEEKKFVQKKYQE